MLGMNNEFSPRFLRRYSNLFEEINKATTNYINDVKSGSFQTKRNNTNEQNHI